MSNLSGSKMNAKAFLVLIFICFIKSQATVINLQDLLKEIWLKSFSVGLKDINCGVSNIASTAEKFVQLRSVNTSKFLQIFKNNVSLSEKPSQYTNITIETIGYKQIRIKGCKANRYLCFNKFSKLVVQENGDCDDCVFEEISIRSNTVCFKSKYRDWYIGVKANGRIQKGDRIFYTEEQKATLHFIIDLI